MLPLVWVATIVLADDVAELESKDPAVARRALEALILRGDESPLLEPAKRSERARTALAEVRASRRFGDAWPAVPLITYQAEDRRTAEVLKDFSRMLGAPVELERDEIPDAVPTPFKEKVTVDLKGSYPLESLAQLGQALGATLAFHEGMVTVWRGFFGARAFVAYHRHVSIAVERYEEVRYRDPSGETTASASLRFRYQHDWLCRPVGVGWFRFSEVTDDLGDSLILEEKVRKASYGHWNNLSTEIGIKASRPGAKALRRVKGTFTLLLPERPATAEMPLEPGKASLKLDNVSLSLESFEKSGATARISGKIGDLAKAHVLPQPNEFTLKGADGRSLAATGTQAGQRESATWELRFDVPAGFQPAALVVRHFQGVGEHEVPFDFGDVPIR